MKLIFLLVALWASYACHAAEYFSERYVVDITHPSIKQEQRIVSFKISLKGAKFDSIDPLPPGWAITVKNESNGIASMEGEIDVGIAAIFVKDFVKMVSLRKYLANEKDFTITGELVLLGGYDESKDVSVRLETRHLRLVKAKP
jgi:hypothetical protein